MPPYDSTIPISGKQQAPSTHQATGQQVCPSSHDGRVTHPETTSRPNKEVTRAGRKTQGLEPPETVKHAVPHALPAHLLILARCEKQFFRRYFPVVCRERALPIHCSAV